MTVMMIITKTNRFRAIFPGCFLSFLVRGFVAAQGECVGGFYCRKQEVALLSQ